MIVGGHVNRPLLSKSDQYTYVGLDVDERPDCYHVYDRFYCQSIEEPVDISADMIVSITLLEHVPNNRLAIKSIYNSLKPGAFNHHYVPSKWHPYSLAL